MSCRKLYLENSDALCARALVVSCSQRKDGAYDIVTDSTPLFPEGGGQLSDTGEMNGHRILHCREENGEVVHRVEAPFAVGDEVEIKVDGRTRRIHTQQHTGEHILSFAYAKLFGAENVGFHMNDEVVTIDLDRMLTDEEISLGEKYANDMVWNDNEVKIYTVTADEAAVLPLRKRNEKLSGDDIRIVEIGGGEMCTCCGTHFSSTAQVGMIKVIDHVRYKQGCRISFACGELAFKWFDSENRELKKAAAHLSVKTDGVYDDVCRKDEQIGQLNAELKLAEDVIAAANADNLLNGAVQANDIKCVFGFVNTGFQAMKRTAEIICDDAKSMTVLFCKDNDRYRYICMSGSDCDINCKNVAMKINESMNAKGGGNPKTAQGSFFGCSEEDIAAFIEKLPELCGGMI